VEALREGAVAIVEKPTALATERLYELGDEVREHVRIAYAARPLTAPLLVEPPSRDALESPGNASRTARAPLLVVGTSTGGPQALSSLLSALPADFPAAIAIALHIPPGYTDSLSRRLDRDSALEVREASEGLEVIPGRAIIAKAGFHLTLTAQGDSLLCHLDVSPYTTPHRPSVDVLFESAAKVGGGREVVGLVMSGMGEDGLAGARKLHEVGARMLTQDEASSVVYGMPRSVVEAGLSDRVSSLQRLPTALTEMFRRR
jgi:two-component system chemotaxis response regulator CheB